MAGGGWLVEEGIGEHRAVRLDGNGAIVAARVEWPGALAAGLVDDARLVAYDGREGRGRVRFEGGEEAHADGLPNDLSMGAAIRVIVRRAAIAERGRTKLAHVRPHAGDRRPAPTIAAQLAADRQPVRVCGRFPECGWDELVAEARDGVLAFAGGWLTLSPTPAMLMIDVDGYPKAHGFRDSMIATIAAAISRFDLQGAIGIDFPTVAGREERRAFDEALAAALDGWRHERTAMNGFGFVQLVSRRERPSLIERFMRDPAGAAARALLRQAEGVADPGTLLLTAHPIVLAAITPEWRAQLARRAGRALRWQADAALAPEAGFAQAVAR